MPKCLVDLFVRPRSVALIGVSSDAQSITARPAHYLRDSGSTTDVTVVKADGQGTMHGLPVVRFLRDMSSPPEVAMVMVPAAAVASVVAECVELGVKGAVVISSGFEGNEGIPRRRELEVVLRRAPGFRLIGPNCVGVMSPAEGSWLTFSSVLQSQRAIPGHVGLITQSGAIGNGLLLALQARGVGLAHWFSTGDEIDVGSLEVAADLLYRQDCRAVGLFLEGVTDSHHRSSLANAISNTGKRVVALRAAASEQGKRAAMGHTGRIVGRDDIARAALKEIGVVMVETLDELTDALTLLSIAPPQPPPSPVSVAVVTVSGATGVMAADELASHKRLELAAFDSSAREYVADGVGTIEPSQVHNPLDVPVLGHPIVFQRAIESVVQLDGVDATVAVVSSLAHDYESLSRDLDSGGQVLAITHLSPAEQFSPEQARRFADRGIAPMRAPRDAVKALSIWAGRHNGASVPQAVPDASPLTFLQFGVSDSVAKLRTIKPWMATSQIVENTEAAVTFFDKHQGAGLVLKADGGTIAHRAEIGAVETNLRSVKATKEAFDRVSAVCANHGDRVLAQAMAPPGSEVMLSVLRDPEVGIAAVLRPGGVFVEAMNASIVLTDARHYWESTLHNSVLGQMLAGWRGGQPYDTHALLDIAASLMSAVESNVNIQLAEANPVIVHAFGHAKGATIVDLITYLDSKKVDAYDLA